MPYRLPFEHKPWNSRPSALTPGEYILSLTPLCSTKSPVSSGDRVRDVPTSSSVPG